MIDRTEQGIQEFLNILHKCWAINSSSKWTLDNPANGQCGVTSLVVNDFFGGDILKTKMPEGWHYYNRIVNKSFDFTKSQFLQKPIYLDLLSNREEAFSDTNIEQYNYLKNRINQYINNTAVSVSSLNLSEKFENIQDVVTWYNNKTKDGIFLHMSPAEIEQIAKDYNTKIVAHVGTDGIFHDFHK